MEKNASDLTVMDVYDLAAAIGQEFERLIERHGCEAAAALMPKVVRALEVLEATVSGKKPELEELHLELERLRMERMEKEKKHKQDLERVEDAWRLDAQDLLSRIAQLQEENKKLVSDISIKDSTNADEEERNEGMTEIEKQVMLKLKEAVDKQRDEIRAKDRELALRNEDVEALQQQQSRLMKINHDLRHKISLVEAQGKALIGQKVELEAGAQARAQEVGVLRQEVARLRENAMRNPDETTKRRTPSPAEGALQVKGHSEVDPIGSLSAEGAWAREALCEDEAPDPNRPRFTLQELRDVLHERNELKAKVFLLQEELGFYKSDDEDDPIVSTTSLPELRTAAGQSESGIKRLFSFFSRDKQRDDASFSSWAKKEEVYTEQAQEALPHLSN